MAKRLSEVVYTVKKVRRCSEALDKDVECEERVIKREGATGNGISQLLLCPQCSKAGILKGKGTDIVTSRQ